MNNLKRIRESKGLSQSKLSELSGVNARMIQHYEQGVKDINKAQAETIYKLSLALDCSVEDLLHDRRQGMKYGYVKSNLQEGIEKQTQALRGFELDKIVVEKTGIDLIELLRELKPGDSLHIVSPDRLTRDMEKYVLILMILELKQVEVIEVEAYNLNTTSDAMLALAIHNTVKDIANHYEDDEDDEDE